MVEAQATMNQDAELTRTYSKQLEGAQKLVNAVAKKHEIEIQLRFVNGTLQAYVRCSAGAQKCNDNNLADLTKKFANEFASKFTKENKDAAFAGLAFVNGGATREQVEKVSKLANGELIKFNEQMKVKFEKATVTLGDAAARSEASGSGGQAEDLGRHASLISREEVDRFLKNARIYGIAHLHKDKGEIEKKDEELWEKTQKKGGDIDAGGVAARVKEDDVEIAIATTGKAGGVGERKSMFKITLNRGAYDKIKETAPELCKSLGNDLTKDGKVNEKALKEFLYVHRNDKKVGETIRNKMIEIFGKEKYAEMEAKAQEEYGKDYPGKKMSKTGFAIGLFYAIATAK